MTKLITLSLSLLFVSASALADGWTVFGNGNLNGNLVDYQLCEEAGKGGVLLYEHDEYLKDPIMRKGARFFLYNDKVYGLGFVFSKGQATLYCHEHFKQ